MAGVTSIIKRVASVLFVAWAVATIVFFASRVIGDPARLILPEGATDSQVQELRTELGLNDPLFGQYADFLHGLLRGDFGTSTWTGDSALSMVAPAVVNTLQLASIALLIALVVGLFLGAAAVARESKALTSVITVLSFIAVSLPEFWFALILVWVFAVHWDVLPPAGTGGAIYMVLPVAVLVVRPIGRLAQTSRRALEECMQEDYAIIAQGKGLSRSAVVSRHGIRNALPSVVTIAGDELVELAAGIVAIELIFAWPGVGYLSMKAIEHRDPYLLVAIVCVASILVVTINLVVEMLYRLIDPRLRPSAARS